MAEHPNVTLLNRTLKHRLPEYTATDDGNGYMTIHKGGREMTHYHVGTSRDGILSDLDKYEANLRRDARREAQFG